MAKILVIEDEPLLAGALQKGLQDQHHAVDVVGDGAEGLKLAAAGAYDLVVLDLMLPGLPGLAVCRRLREAGGAMPILMITARDTTADVVAGLDAGADDYLTKPFAFPEMLARVRTLLRRVQGGAGPRLRVGTVVVVTAQRRGWRDGREVALTVKELGILELLVRRRGMIQSKDAIANAVWRSDERPDPNVIEVHVASLRRKLERGRAPLIQTVRGVGYVIRGDDG
jgi:DNA-binding response OmpR family regulator